MRVFFGRVEVQSEVEIISDMSFDSEKKELETERFEHFSTIFEDGEGDEFSVSIPCILPKEVTEIEIKPWYRGDRREPMRIFEEGFTSRGSNTNVLEHVLGNEYGPISDSAYVSTSISKEAATRYPERDLGRSYIYLINPQRNAIDINPILVLEIDSGELIKEAADYYLADKEMAVPYQIKPKDIRGAWVAESAALSNSYEKMSDLYQRTIDPASFIRNPHHTMPYAKTTTGLKVAGGALTAVGIYLDTTGLFESYKNCEKSGNFHAFFTESARVVGGWNGAIALGHSWGIQSAKYGLRFKHPGVAIGCGVVGSLVGSVIGYMGGGVIVSETYDRFFDESKQSIWSDLYLTLKCMEPVHQDSVNAPSHQVNVGQPNLHEKLDHFWKVFQQELREEGSISGVIKKHLPVSSPEKPNIKSFLQRLDYRDVSDSISAKRTAEEMFGKVAENPLRRSHSASESLRHTCPMDEHPAALFKEAKVESLSAAELRHHTVSLFKHASMENPKRRSKRHPSTNESTMQLAHDLEQKRSERELAQEDYAKKCYALTERVQKINEHLRTDESLQPNRPTQDVSFSDGCKAISSATSDLAIIANAWHLPGGRELSIIGKGTERIAAGSLLLCMKNAPAFATPLGWLSVVAGIATLTTLGDEDSENDAIAELKLALVQLGMMLNQVLQNQQKMNDTLEVILKSVLDVEARVKQHQTETRASLFFISTYQLQDACLAIQGDLAKTNAVSLTPDARREALSTLERWLNQHLFHAGLSREASGPTSSTLAVETLSTNPAMNTMGLILTQLQTHIGVEHVPNEFVHLPPLNLFIHVAQLFLTGVLYAELPSDDGCEALCNKLVDVVQTYAKLIDYLRTELVIWDALFAQYEHQRNMVGRALSAASIPNQAVPIDSLVTNDLKRRNLMDALDCMEEKRWLLVRLVEFAFDGSVQTLLHQKVHALESKQRILSTHASVLYTARQHYYPNTETQDTTNMQLALRSGVELNQLHGGGNILNYIGYLLISGWSSGWSTKKQWMVDAFCLLMRQNSAGEQLNPSLISLYVPGSTWWNDNYAMRMWLNCTQYNIPLLLIIAGFDDTSWDYYLTGNLARNNSHSASEVKMLVSSTLRSDGLLNKHKLRRAFQYYQIVINGEHAKAEHMLSEGVDAYCVLWLVSLLGNWSVFERLEESIEFPKTVGTFQFTQVEDSHVRWLGPTGTIPRKYEGGYLTTDMCAGATRYGNAWPITSRYTPLMIAAEHGRADVIEGFIKLHESGHDVGLIHTLAWGDSAASLAFQHNHFEIAQRLYDFCTASSRFKYQSFTTCSIIRCSQSNNCHIRAQSH